MKDEDYFARPELSYSGLARFDKDGVAVFSTEVEHDKEYYHLGALVEELIDGDIESVNAKFLITDNTRPTAMLGELADAMIENNATHNSTTAFTLAKGLGLWANIKNDETFTKKFDIPQFWGWLKLQDESRRVVSKDIYYLAKAMAKGLTDSQYTSHIFKSNKKNELISQPVILWGKGKYKSKLDFIKINHTDKTITPYDLKTSAFPVEDFRNQFYKFRYYIQSSMYTDALREWAFTNYNGYTLKPFKFIVVSRTKPGFPLVYTVPESIINSGRDNFYNDDGVVWRRGYLQLTEDFEWHIDNKAFDYNRIVYEFNGDIELT